MLIPRPFSTRLMRWGSAECQETVAQSTSRLPPTTGAHGPIELGKTGCEVRYVLEHLHA